jgi:hypothetical protein
MKSGGVETLVGVRYRTVRDDVVDGLHLITIVSATEVRCRP